MKRAHWIAVLALACAFLAWRLAALRGGSAAALSPPAEGAAVSVPPRPEPTAEPETAPEPAGARRSAESAAGATEAAVAPPSAGLGLAGRAWLSDGFPLDDESLGAVAENGQRVQSARTDAEGAFAFEGLAPGSYRIGSARPNGLVRPGTRFAAGERDVRVVFDSLRVRLRVVDGAGAPAARARVSFAFTPAGAVDPEGSYERATDDEGVLRWYTSSTGSAAFTAFSDDGGATGSTEVWVAPGISGAWHELVLEPRASDSSLRVRVACSGDCGESPFLVRIHDAATGVHLRTLQWEDRGADGALHGLPAGRLRVVLGNRYIEPLASYDVGTRGPAVEVELAPDRVAEALFAVTCRARLRATIAGPAEEGTPEVYRVLARRDDELEWTALSWMRRTGPDTIEVSHAVPRGAELASEEPLESGSYWLAVERDGRRSDPVPVLLGECGSVSVALEPPP